MKWIIILLILIIPISIIVYFNFHFHPSISIKNPTKVAPTKVLISPTAPPMESNNIRVSSPRQYEKTAGRFVISGQARVFENEISFRVKKIANNSLLIEDQIYVDSPDVGKFGPFTYIVDVTKKKLKPGDQLLVEVYQASPKDGSDADKVTIYITYSP